MKSTFILLICIISSTAASFFLKTGSANRSGENGFLETFVSSGTILGGAFYIMSFLAYVLALRIAPLSLAQPVVTAGVSLLTSLIAVLYFHERLNLINWTGLLLVFLGIGFLFFRR